MVVASCGASDDEATTASSTPDAVTTATTAAPDDLYPDVVRAIADPTGEGTWTITATLSSPYDSPERYADAWRVLAPDGTELGIRELSHDHADEQPFSRSLVDVAIPDDVETITIEGRDQRNGWGGETFTVDLES